MARSLLFLVGPVLVLSIACGGTDGVPIGESPSEITEPAQGETTSPTSPPSGSATATAGDPEAAELAPPEPNKPKRVFVTSKSYRGNLRDQTHAADGFRAADELCQGEAEAFKLGGSWKAFLSGKVKGEPLKAIDRLVEVGPWFLVDGTTKVFDGLQGLTSTPLARIDMLADGKRTTSDRAWTGTRAGGPVGPSCEDMTGTSWSSSSIFRAGTNGNPLEIARWSDDRSPSGCSASAPLYCFEQ